MRTQAPVLVLHFHHGSLGIARSLGRLGVRVYGVDADPHAPGLSSRYCRGGFAWDFRTATPAESVDFLLRVGEFIGSPAILIPTTDHLALLVAEHADTLAARFLFPRVSPELVRALSDKRELYLLSRQLGIPTAETVFPRSRDQLFGFLETATFPVMLKGIDGLRLEVRTGRKMLIVHNVDELLAAYDRMEDPAAPNLMLQEYIPGGDDTIWMFNGYFDANSDCVAGFTGRKLRQHPVHTGATSLGICERNDRVDELTRGFMKRIGYRGILDIGYRYDARDGEYKLLDPNPRIGSTFRLFLSGDGMDVVRYLYRDLTNQPLPPARLREGRKWIIEDKDAESSLDYAREGTLTFGQWLRSLWGVQEAAWFALDDLAPFRRVAWDMIGRARRAAPKRVGSVAPVPPPLGAASVEEAVH